MGSELERGTDEREAIFTWRGGGVVLIAERSDSAWVVARGWLHGDQLTDIRRWSFSSSQLLAGQIRRLVREATRNHLDADAAVAEIVAWAARQAPSMDGYQDPVDSIPLDLPDRLTDSVD